MQGFKQAGRIENDRLTAHLDNFGYSTTRLTPGLWRHKSQPITFSLVVDNFGVKYVGKKNANQLLTSLCKLYTVTVDWTGRIFSGMNLEWNYIEKYVDVSMPGYIPYMLHHFQHSISVQCQYAPTHGSNPHTVPKYSMLLAPTTHLC